MEFIKKHSPTTTFTVTSRQASKGKKKNRYVEESPLVMGILKRFSEEVEKVVETYGV